MQPRSQRHALTSVLPGDGATNLARLQKRMRVHSLVPLARGEMIQEDGQSMELVDMDARLAAGVIFPGQHLKSRHVRIIVR